MKGLLNPMQNRVRFKAFWSTRLLLKMAKRFMLKFFTDEELFIYNEFNSLYRKGLYKQYYVKNKIKKNAYSKEYYKKKFGEMTDYHKKHRDKRRLERRESDKKRYYKYKYGELSNVARLGNLLLKEIKNAKTKED